MQHFLTVIIGQLTAICPIHVTVVQEVKISQLENSRHELEHWHHLLLPDTYDLEGILQWGNMVLEKISIMRMRLHVLVMWRFQYSEKKALISHRPFKCIAAKTMTCQTIILLLKIHILQELFLIITGWNCHYFHRKICYPPKYGNVRLHANIIYIFRKT